MRVIKSWSFSLPNVVLTINSLRSESTGFSPFEVVFGQKQKPRTNFESVFPTIENAKKTANYAKFMEEMLSRHSEIQEKVLKTQRVNS